MAADFEAACTDMAMVRERVELVVAPDLSNDAVVDLYSKWARHYDQVGLHSYHLFTFALLCKSV